MATSTKLRVERRRASRLIYRDLKIVYDGMACFVNQRSPDLSTRGIFVNTPRSYPAGARLRLRFGLLRTRINVEPLGDVRYCLPGIGIGVHFVDLPQDARAAIETELEEMRSQSQNQEVEST